MLIKCTVSFVHEFLLFICIKCLFMSPLSTSKIRYKEIVCFHLRKFIVWEPNPYFPLNLELRVKVFFSADSGTLRVTFHHPSG
jgi:hypothetical protein